MKLSVCMIVKDEEKNLSSCLDCVKNFADEIIIVDTGSKDKTKQIAKRYTDKVYDFKWCDDFSMARNYSFSLATKDYIMWLDADDFIPQKEQEKIKTLMQELDTTKFDCIMCYYVASIKNPQFLYYRERIVKNHFGFIWREPVHEAITPFGDIKYCNIKIYHNKVQIKNPKRNLKIYQKLLKNKVPLSPRGLYYYARELFYNGYYKKAITYFNKFLKSDGWVENKIDACIVKAECYLKLNRENDAFSTLLSSFSYAKPRAKICCMLANFFVKNNDFKTAKFWFKQALGNKENNGGFIEVDFYTFIPSINLCMCCYRLGEFKASKHYHILAKIYKPNANEVLYNDQFFK